MKLISEQRLSQILGALPANARVVASGNFATPHTLLRVADQAMASFKLHMLNAQPGIPDRDGISYESAFVGAGMRRHPRLNYVPSRLSLVPVLFRDHFKPDVVLLNTSSVRGGKVSLGTEVNVLPAAIEAARANGGLVIAQANAAMPYTFGDAEISLEDIDFLVDVDEALAQKPEHPSTDAALSIGDRITAMVADGSTLQLGIGAIPDAVVRDLAAKRGLRVWTEMFSDGVLALEQAGALDRDRQITASFMFGSQELYDWANLNENVRMLRTETTNNPANIAKQNQMTSINTALQIDLYDQATASHVRGDIYSGFGGSTDFIVGALHSPGGKSFMALSSWHPKAKVSTIVPRITEYVTSFQHSH
ncbi:MAG: acetyl-CoA hydrolase/transferase family protein, partial [Rhodoluna sp.]